MKLIQREERVEDSYYKRKRRKLKRSKNIKKYILMVVFLLIIPAITILYHADSLQTAHNELLESISDNSTINILIERREADKAQKERLSKYDETLAKLGTMGEAIKRSGIEFGENEDEQLRLIGLMIGIANAESSLGKNFVVEYDKNCHNWWGLKGGNMTKRADGSSLRCFISEDAGARTIAKTLKLYYLDEGRTTPEKIVTKYVGAKWTQYHDVWVGNVNKFYKE